MKHPVNVTVVLVLLFFLSQLFGLAILSKYIQTSETGEVAYRELTPIFGYQPERPELSNSGAVLSIVVALILGTCLILLLMKFNSALILKIWFFIAVALCLNFTLGILVLPWIANLLAVLITAVRFWRPSTLIHNVTELLVYSGLAAIFVSLLDIGDAIVLLLLISGYDAYAVWKSRHMVRLAKFQAKAGFFAGLAIPTVTTGGTPAMRSKRGKPGGIAVLGGGDMGFPLLLSGAVLKSWGFAPALVVTVCATVALALLFAFARKDRYYPAMPFITSGLLVGLGLSALAF